MRKECAWRMVIVVFHALASAFVYIRERFRMGYLSLYPARNGTNSHCGNSNNSSCFQWLSGRRLEFQQDAFAPILDASDVTELRDAIHCSVKQCLPRVERLMVFLKNPVTEETEADGVILPTRGVIRDAYDHSPSLHICSVPHDPDPVLQLLNLHPSDSSKVLLLPISSRHGDFCLGIIVACFKADGLSIEEEKYVRFLQKQVSLAYTAVKQSHIETETDQLESLMRLCGDLHDQDAATLELKVIRYLREQTDAESGFLLLVVPETLELISQVVGNTILPEEVRFPGLWSCFAPALETKQPMSLEHIPQDRKGEAEKIVEMKVHSFLCVPVARKGSQDLLALVCLVNKLDEDNRFTDTDIQIVRQCFTYTATVLTSTLAFQNERKLKNQTQALLQVARKLFTRLGECAQETERKPKESALVFSITRFIHAFCIRYMEQVEAEAEAQQAKKNVGSRRFTKRAMSTSVIRTMPSINEKGIVSQSLSPKDQHERKNVSIQKKVVIRENVIPSLNGVHENSSAIDVVDMVMPASEEEVLRRFQEKRKRKMSHSFFLMYDPTSHEAESSSEEESESSSEEIIPTGEGKQEESVPQAVLVSQVSDGNKTSTSSSSGEELKPILFSSSETKSSQDTGGSLSFKSLFRPIISYPFTKSSPITVTTTPSILISENQSTPVVLKSSSQIPKRQSIAVMSSTSRELENLQKMRRTDSKRYWKKSLMTKRVPFSYLRTLPAEAFALPDGTISPFIERIRQNAPADAAYSDGDFMCMMLGVFLFSFVFCLALSLHILTFVIFF